jgi:hypothetical protein
MRHFATLLVAIPVAPLSWLLLAFGQGRPDQTITGVERTLACLVGAGLLVGLLATVRLSLLGVALTGVAYAAAHVAALAFPEATLGLFPHSVSVAGRSVDPTAPLRTGTALVLAVIMLAAAIGLGRRRSFDERTREPAPDIGRPGQSPPGPAASHYSAGSRHPDNRRSGSFGPANNDSRERWRRSRQLTWPDR